MAYANGYTYRRTVTVDSDKVAGGLNFSNFPVLFSGTYDYLADTDNGGKVTDSSGFDIIFTSDSDGNTQLDHEIESYDNTTGALSFWVSIPTLSALSDTTFYIFYANSNVTTSQESVASVWSDYQHVYHMNDLTTSTVEDSAGNQDGAKTSANNPAEADGKISKAQDFDAKSEIIRILSATDPTEYSISLWVKLDSATATQIAIFRTDSGEAGSVSNEIAVRSDSGTAKWRGQLYDGSTRAVFGSEPTTNWIYLTSTAKNNGTLYLYEDGNEVGTPDSNVGTMWQAGDRWLINKNNATIGLLGLIDEVRIKLTQDSASWILTDYNTQNSPSTFYSISVESEFEATGEDQILSNKIDDIIDIKPEGGGAFDA